MNGWMKRQGRHTRTVLVLACTAFLQACTISGADFLTSNTGGGLEPYTYPPGQQEAGTITVKKGDTLFSIARYNEIDLWALIEENNIAPPYDLKPGDVLRIPGPKVHVVARGETIYSISRAYGVGAVTLASLNGISAPYAISVGDKLQLPGGAGKAKKAGSDKKKGQKTSVGKTTKAVARSTPRGGGRFKWPVHGTIISSYGSKGGGRQNDGINIAVAIDTPVTAADGGTITYVGNELRGYGNLILIKHRGDWVTAYAHNKDIWVKKGQAVRRGEHIANAGQTGDADRPQVHFELRRGSKSVDPEKYLNMD